MTPIIEIRICDNSDCGLRYPLLKGHHFGERCPACLGPTHSVSSRELSLEPDHQIVMPTLELEGLLDNVRSAWNVGAMFRTADCLGIQKLHLCGITPTPTNTTLKKTSIGAEESVPWVYSNNAVETAKILRDAGAHLWALEQDERAVPVGAKFDQDEKPIILIVGNEVSGVDPELLDLCERIINIPMFGMKRSLNVEVAFGIAVAILRNGNRQT